MGATNVFTAVPYGEVEPEVPDMFVEHCKARGLPLGPVPVAPEVKAGKLMEEATDAAKRDELANMHKQLTEAVASEKAAKVELEKSLAVSVKLEQEKSVLALELKNALDKAKKLIDDNAELTKLFETQAKELEIKTQEAARSLAVIEELKKPVNKEPVAQVPEKSDKQQSAKK